ncbi:MAG: hypothetical protein P1V20_22960 [Verrucomicrobiales bacterium]|nr:hypothetical protein [Verrucomicrobiales bacterium]
MKYDQNSFPDIDSIEFECEVTAPDIDKMFELFDSGMCDIASQNAAALAVKRSLRLKGPAKISRCGPGGKWWCDMGRRKLPVKSDLSNFFESVDSGNIPVGFRFKLLVPSDLLPKGCKGAVPAGI